MTVEIQNRGRRPPPILTFWGEWVRGIAKFEANFKAMGLGDMSFCSPGMELGACEDHNARPVIFRPPQAPKVDAFFDTFAPGVKPSFGGARRFKHHRIDPEKTFPTSPHSYFYVQYPRRKHSGPLLQVVKITKNMEGGHKAV